MHATAAKGGEQGVDLSELCMTYPQLKMSLVASAFVPDVLKADRNIRGFPQTSHFCVNLSLTSSMDTQTRAPQRPRRQRTLESQRSDREHNFPNTQTPLQLVFSILAAGLWRSTGLQGASDVDAALAAAAKRHEGGDIFVKKYQRISHSSQFRLHDMFDTFVREPLQTSTSRFCIQICQNVSADTMP